MIDTFITKSMLENDIEHLKKLPMFSLSKTENDLVSWLVDYHESHGSLPDKERFEKTEYSHYWNTHLTGNPFTDILDMTLDHLKNVWFNDQLHQLQEKLETSGDIATSDLSNISKKLGLFTTAVVNDIFTVDRTDLYSHDLPKNVLMFDWFDIDYGTGGVFPGETCVLVARPGTGKSLLSFYQAVNWARKGKKVLVISSEMAIQQMVSRFDAMLANFNPLIHRTKEDFSLLDKYALEIEKELTELKTKGGNIIFPHQGTVNTSTISGLLSEHNPDVLIVDGVYLIDASKRYNEGWQKEAAVITEISQMALDHNIPVFATTQLKRTNTTSHFTLEDIAGSDFYGKVADIVIGAWPFTDEISTEIVLKILKNRNGKMQGLTSLAIDWDTCTINEKKLAPKGA